jgi:molybdopterin molybdotransferase
MSVSGQPPLGERATTRAPDRSPLPTPAQAEERIRSRILPLPVEPAPLASVTGRVLRETVIADRDQPPFHRVAMDGIAIDSASSARTFSIVGTQPAGAPQHALPDAGSCFEVMTGAVLPAGSDCVVPVERIAIADGAATLDEDVAPESWQNVHRRGTDCRAGDQLIQPGLRIGPPEIAVLATAGYAHVATARPPSIMIVSTGDELVEPGDPVADWQIRSSNGYALIAALTHRGFGRLAQDRLPDDESVLRERLRAHLDTHDVVILSGGVSMGRFDFVPAVLHDLGVERVLHRIAQRPGKPMWFGVRAPDKAVFALPGNPVSALVCCVRYVLPGLLAAMGASPVAAQRVALALDFEVKPALSVFLPVAIATSPEGRLEAEPRPTRGSGDLTSPLGTDGFVELTAGPRLLTAGSLVPFYPWRVN